MLTLFALVVVGFVAGKLGYLGGDFDRQLSRLVINITCPALILSSAMTGELPDRRYILPLLLISVLTYLLLSVAGFLLPRYLVRDRAVQGAVGFALIFGNVGFMGYPVVASIFGHEAVFYAAVLNVVNTFAVFTIGTILITGASSDQERFENYLSGQLAKIQLPNKDEAFLRERMLTMYANPVRNYINASLVNNE
jgi:predicted permease